MLKMVASNPCLYRNVNKKKGHPQLFIRPYRQHSKLQLIPNLPKLCTELFGIFLKINNTCLA
jgi:hypothetical protein